MTTGYLFKDTRDERRPFVLFIDGLKTEEGGEPKTFEVKFASFEEMAQMILGIFWKRDAFNVEFGKPNHYEDA